MFQSGMSSFVDSKICERLLEINVPFYMSFNLAFVDCGDCFQVGLEQLRTCGWNNIQMIWISNSV